MEPTAIRSILINTGNFPPTFHSPAMGSGRHHLAVKSPPAAGRITEHVNLLRQTQSTKKDDAPNEHKLCQYLIEGGRNPIETEKSFDSVIFGGIQRAGSVIVDGLEMSQNATVKMG